MRDEPQITEFKELFSKIELLKKQQAALNALDQEKESKLAEKRNEFINFYKHLMDEHVSIEAIINVKKTGVDEFYIDTLWEQSLSRLIESVPLKKINSGKLALDETCIATIFLDTNLL